MRIPTRHPLNRTSLNKTKTQSLTPPQPNQIIHKRPKLIRTPTLQLKKKQKSHNEEGADTTRKTRPRRTQRPPGGARGTKPPDEQYSLIQSSELEGAATTRKTRPRRPHRPPGGARGTQTSDEQYSLIQKADFEGGATRMKTRPRRPQRQPGGARGTNPG